VKSSTTKAEGVKKLDSNITLCQCADVKDDKQQGGANCKSRDIKTGLAFCFVQPGVCVDEKFSIGRGSGIAFKSGFKVSFDACACQNNAAPCKCADVTDVLGQGGKACNSTMHKGTPPFCYTKSGVCCDGKASDSKKGFDLSFDACACTNNAFHCQCTGMVDSFGNGNCYKGAQQEKGGPMRPFCYTKPGACCDGQPRKLQGSRLPFDLSFDACNGKYRRRRVRHVVPTPVNAGGSGSHTYWIAIVVFIIVLVGMGYYGYQFKKRMAATETPGAGVATPNVDMNNRTSAANRHRPPPAVYGPLTGKVRVNMPGKPLDGKMMWASSYNEQQNTYVCKTHEPGPSGVHPHYINAEYLVAEVE